MRVQLRSFNWFILILMLKLLKTRRELQKFGEPQTLSLLLAATSLQMMKFNKNTEIGFTVRSDGHWVSPICVVVSLLNSSKWQINNKKVFCCCRRRWKLPTSILRRPKKLCRQQTPRTTLIYLIKIKTERAKCTKVVTVSKRSRNEPSESWTDISWAEHVLQIKFIVFLQCVNSMGAANEWQNELCQKVLQQSFHISLGLRVSLKMETTLRDTENS